MNDREDSLGPFREGYEGAAHFYDLFADNSDIPFYLKYAELLGSPILDLAAGTGRVTFALAQQGFHVYALEKSPAMLSEAYRKLSRIDDEVAGKIHLIAGDMRNFSLGKKFRLVIIPASFGHALTTEEQLSTLRCIREHLDDEGLFILDLFSGGAQPDYASFEEPPVKLSKGRSVSRSGVMKTNPVDQIIELDLTFTVRDETTNKILEEMKLKSGFAIIHNHEVELLLKISGFEISEEFGDFNSTSYTSESGRRILVLNHQK
ncbi:MAG: class I SAM-dependent DNA methyltransferase [Candidatus Thorarchaeota archaeon]|jgi:SAM-dependent methyltransferase